MKKGYRDAPYHNWIHAFSVTHFSYLLMKNLRLIDDYYISSLEAFVFLVSCLCHDIDHRGTNNSFQTKCGTVLASLYSSEGSVMEVKLLLFLIIWIARNFNFHKYVTLSSDTTWLSQCASWTPKDAIYLRTWAARITARHWTCWDSTFCPRIWLHTLALLKNKRK